MNKYDATEISYSNGYKQGVKDLAERVKETKFKHGNEYMIYADNIDQIAEEMLGERSEK